MVLYFKDELSWTFRLRDSFYRIKIFLSETKSFIQDGGLVPDEDNSEMEQLRAEVEQLKGKLMEEQSKSVATGNDEEFQVKEKLHQDTKARANKAEQEVEAQKVWRRVTTQGLLWELI